MSLQEMSTQFIMIINEKIDMFSAKISMSVIEGIELSCQKTEYLEIRSVIFLPPTSVVEIIESEL